LDPIVELVEVQEILPGKRDWRKYKCLQDGQMRQDCFCGHVVLRILVTIDASFFFLIFLDVIL
jgi:hypothetical protein